MLAQLIFGDTRATLGAVLRPAWGCVGPAWGYVGPSPARIDLCWKPVERYVGPCGSILSHKIGKIGSSRKLVLLGVDAGVIKCNNTMIIIFSRNNDNNDNNENDNNSNEHNTTTTTTTNNNNNNNDKHDKSDVNFMTLMI